MRAFGIVVALAIVVLAGCTVATSQEGHGHDHGDHGHDHGDGHDHGSHDGDGIVARSKAWEAAFNAGDLEKLVTFYAKDTRFLPPNDKMMTGHDGVRVVLGEMVEAKMGGKMERLETVEAGDIGYNVGTFTIETADGEVVDRGKFIETWRKIDGSWLITNDIFNSDMPAAHGHDHGH